MLELRDVHTYYGKSYILQGVSLEVKRGSLVALLGRNGMGKTTTISSIMGFARVSRGIIRFKGNDITSFKPYRIAGMGIGLVPQGRRVFPSLSVERNLTVIARTGDNPEPWSLDRVYSLFPILKERARQKANLLSGGEQQMLTISRALMTNPDLVLMDEPSEGLAPLIVLEISEIIRKLHQNGLSVLLVEQNLPMALDLADYTYVMSRGLIVYNATAQDLKENEEIQVVHLGVAR
jgi:branched-chain amino acid transport system ATP-binding protein